MSELKGRILYAGQSYYHTWYISRELRKIGWKADVLNFDPSEQSKPFYFGEDYLFHFDSKEHLLENLAFYFNTLSAYDIYHFNNMNGLSVITEFDTAITPIGEAGYDNVENGFRYKIIRRLTLFLLGTVCKWRDTRVTKVVSFLGVKRVHRLLARYRFFLPERWDILLLKKLGKLIVYGNCGCQDGVLQSTFKKWSTPDQVPVCEICPWEKVPGVCSDERNERWGRLRNRLADYQMAAGGNKADFNDDPRVHDLPWWGCIDENLWNPDSLIPSNYLLPIPKETVKIYHAVGNYESRAQNGNKTIKSTHIYLPLIEELKREGYNVELIFFQDVPLKKIHYYQAQADIVVDMLTYGFFGANVREGLMMGKPCICYLRPEWMEQMKVESPDYINEMPVISATPATIKEVLIDLIIHPEKRKEIGERSRKFALKFHAPAVAAREMSKIYSGIMARPGQPKK